MTKERLNTTRNAAEKPKFLQTGDVFTSPKLAYGYRDYFDRTPVITIDGQPNNHVVTQSRSTKELLQHAAKTGEILPEDYEVDYNAYDATRALAHFVVTHTEHPYGHSGMGGMDQGSPTEHIVRAQRLTEDDMFNPDGEQIKFNQMGWGHNITPEDVVILSMMQQRFV